MSAPRRSILFQVGVAVSLIAALAIVSNLLSMVIADNSAGRAKAINLSGSLRMLSHRLSAQALSGEASPLIQTTFTDYQSRLQELGALINPNGTESIDRIHQSWKAVQTHWQNHFAPMIQAYLQSPPHPENQTLAQEIHRASFVMVEKANTLVGLLEEDLEVKILFLRWSVGILLVLTLFIAFLTMLLMKTQVVLPVNALLKTAQDIRDGNWQARADLNQENEIGTLATILNAMMERLADLYSHLEEKVREKTHDLGESNRRLQLLYQSAQTLSIQKEGAGVGRSWQAWIALIRSSLPLADLTLCLYQHRPHHAEPIDPINDAHCQLWQCHLCENANEHPPSGYAHIPLRYGDATLGILLYRPLPSWQDDDLLQALSQHLVLAILRDRQFEEHSRLLIHEERSVLARELHDSLAQELVYLKMQVGILESQTDHPSSLKSSLTLINKGLQHALIELRELIASFRLTKSNAPLPEALSAMKAEFFARSGLAIDIHINLPERLAGAQEAHVVRIIREALINTIKHAHATHALIDINAHGEHGVIVRVCDNGGGLPPSMNPSHPQRHHFGLSIMHDRARMLGGSLHIANRHEGGLMIELTFPRKTSTKKNVAD